MTPLTEDKTHYIGKVTTGQDDAWNFISKELFDKFGKTGCDACPDGEFFHKKDVLSAIALLKEKRDCHCNLSSPYGSPPCENLDNCENCFVSWEDVLQCFQIAAELEKKI